VGGWTGVPRNGNTNNRETEMPNDRQKSFLASTTGTLVRRQFIASSLALVGAPLLATGAVGQARPFPERPIRIVVPFAAGGGVDAFARLLAEKLRQKHGWATVIDNRPGANGTLGAAAVKDAEPNGLTLLFSAGTHVMARHVMKSAPYDPMADFASIARVGEAPMMLIMSPKMAPRTVAELLAEAKKDPSKWTFATSALGAPGHLATIAFNHLSGLNLTVVAYRGTAPAMNDVAGGHVQLMIDPVLALLPMASANQVKGLAVTSAQRTSLAPDFPTVAESGLPGLKHSSWYGVWGPKKLSADLAAELNGTINAAVQDLAKEGRLATLGIEPVSESPSQFEEFAKSYVAQGAELLKAAKFDPV
jgi:tripartite-type tricarboxylate transporter receptor subunit TctC